QAYLDYYNLNQNWLARCFTIEYAIWFRLVLQGVERMKLPVPLGGTSVFFRREALQKLGAWDAHNVTEDADLGMRLARFGYRCAFEPTTTYEEANCHTIPWVKQRSRWLKGYAMTWITHMRNPRALWRDLGPKGFLTFQVILLGTLSSFLLAPAIWSFWLISFGFTPGFAAMLPDVAWNILGVTFVGSEIILALLGVAATSGKNHRFLIPWVPTMVFYWPLGTIAAYKAMYEVLFAPFYWDKTKHGISNTKM
ncbi:MAG: cellulose synthase/poly-beta-1,6-N-acetylglucosamine synthase-like glycosyltransferase, partial [Paracoccaceae bacterium]